MTVMLICPGDDMAKKAEEMLISASDGKTNIIRFSSAPDLLKIDFDADIVLVFGMNAKKAATAFAECAKLNSGFVYIAGAKNTDEDIAALYEMGVHTVFSPISKSALWHDMTIAACVPKRISAMKNENSALVSRLAEEKIISRAKLVIMEYLKLSEAQAHRYIEKQAMDLRIPRAEVAARILETYEN